MTDLRQAAKQALEALEAVHTDFVCRATHHKKKDQHGGLDICPNATRHITTITALKAALEQQAEPVAWMFQHEETGRIMCVEAQQVEGGFEKGNPRLKKIAPLYTTPPQRKPLTEEEIIKMAKQTKSAEPGLDGYILPVSFARAIEAAHGIKGEV